MRKHSLVPNKGLSLSQAQSISNLCNQEAKEIERLINKINNYSKSIQYEGVTHLVTEGFKMPSDIVDKLKRKAALHACQAFLMENIKAKDSLLTTAMNESADISEIEFPEKPKVINPLINQLPSVNENWGWEQLSVSEYNEFLEAEAFASHIGQFIHKDSKLDHLRSELPDLPLIEWMTIKDGEKTMVTLKRLHEPEELLNIHNELAALHRQYEQRVNYFKAKVKNLVTQKNAEIAKHNADVQNETSVFNNKANAEYTEQYNAALENVKSIQMEFEKKRQKNINEIASMRINVDSRFQSIIDGFLKELDNSEDCQDN